MIRLRRGDEPEDLRWERRRRRALCMLIHCGVRVEKMELDDGYTVAARALRTAQRSKCAYCEGQIRETGIPLDHFRPKAAVYDARRKRIADGYWWLTWSWENLLRACGTCNDASHKGNRFALEDESQRLKPGEAPPGAERPLLIDPCREDPLRLIEFRRRGLLDDGRVRWVPMPRRGLDENDTRRAVETIDVFGLADGDLPTFYADWIGGYSRDIEAVSAAIARGDEVEIAREWACLVGHAFSNTAPYQGLAWDLLHDRFPES